MKKNILMVIILTIAAMVFGCGGADNDDVGQGADSHAIKLLPPGNSEIYFGAFPDFGGDEEHVTKERINDFENLAKKKLMWAPFSQNWFEGIIYPKESIHTLHDEGVVPLVRMQPRSSTAEYVRETEYTLEKIINGAFDRELMQWAKDAKTDNIPILIDFGVEMNGKWFPWNGYWNGGGTKDSYGDPSYPDGPEKYRDAYRHIIDIFRSEEVYHVTWFFHPTMYTQEPGDEWNAPKWYYPGDDYIDWIGVSIYGALHPKERYWDTFAEVLESNNAYKKILEISNHKPFSILEFGVTDHHPLGSKSQWLTDAFNIILAKKYLNFQAITYWHENWDNDGSLTSLKINSSKVALSAFQKAIHNPRFISYGKFSNDP